MNKYYLLILLYFSTAAVNAIPPGMNSISLEDIYNKDHVLDVVSHELLRFIREGNQYFEVVNFDNFESIYELEYERHETIYLFVYWEGMVVKYYYIVLSSVNKQNGQAKVLAVSEIDKIEQTNIFPLRK
jgi:hypothetical protein